MKTKNISSKKVMLVTAMLIFVAFLAFFVPNISAASPTVAYSSISDDEQFVDVVNGIGVNLTVRVDDSDSNLQSVNIHTNATGSWVSIYGSGALGGVASHNTSQFVVDDWLDSWTTYYFRITANDGGDTVFHYSFTTEYVFGDWQLLVSDEYENYAPTLYKNATGDYWMQYSQGATPTVFMRSDNGVDWVFKDSVRTDVGSFTSVPTLNTNFVTYNNEIYTYTQTDSDSYRTFWQRTKFNGTTWIVSDTNVYHAYFYCGHGYANGAKMIYYDGGWFALMGLGTASGDYGYSYLNFYSIDNPDDLSLTPVSTLKSNGASARDGYIYGQNLGCYAVYNGTLYLFYRGNSDTHIYYRTYDGISLSSEQSLPGADIHYTYFRSETQNNVGGMGITVDYTNDQMVLVYIDTNDDMVYRVSTNGVNWSEKQIIADTSGYDGDDIQHCEPWFIDGRIMVTFSSDAFAEDTHCIYSISAPSYSDVISGASDKLSKFSWPDASPGATDINSSVFEIVNMNDRDILNITWHVGNIGDIPSANNVKMWSNMSGSWTSYQVGADQNISTIDISAVKGSEWLPAEKIYWKIEIETIDAGITETSHIADYNIYYWIDLEAV